MKLLIPLYALLLLTVSAPAQESCYSRLEGDTLTIGNALI